MSSLTTSLLISGLMVAGLTQAQTAPEEDETWSAHFQTTYIWQLKPAFQAAYSGPNSLTADRAHSYSWTGTAALGWRLWQGAELYFNPEVALGLPFSNLTGLGGFSNGELARTAGTNPTFYRARLFLRQTFNLGGETIYLAPEANQLGSHVQQERWVITAGNVSAIDIFDDNRYAHDARTQFMNWSLITHGAYDFAADARGYTWGIAAEYYHNDWALRVGRFIQPREPNQQQLDTRMLQYYGDQIELERAHQIAGQDGKLRLLVFRNRAVMARYRDALQLAANQSAPPDLTQARLGAQIKYGAGINLEQAITPTMGLFARASWADGQTETYAFTHIDRNLSAGLSLQGQQWGRAQDVWGVALSRNQLSRASQDYLAAGGIAFFIGDGQLTYRPETILESYYNFKLTRGVDVGFNVQHIQNPAYNARRGPAQFYAVRLHAEF